MFKNFLLLISVLLLFLSAVVAAACHRPLLGEASTWYLNILTNASTYYDTTFFRHTDRILQIPAALLVEIFGAQYLKLAIYVQHFFYSIHPFLSLLICYVILKKAKRSDLMVFPILSCVTAVFSAYQQVMLLSVNAISIFWPLFFLILLGLNKTIFQKISIVILLILLTFTYEPAILFFVVLVSLVLFTKTGNQFSKNFKRLFVLYCILSILFLAYIALRSRSEVALGVFAKSLGFGLDAYRVYVVLMVLFFALFFYLVSKNYHPKRKVDILLSGLFSLPVAYFFLVYFNLFDFGSTQQISIFTTYFARTTSIPIAAAIACIAAQFYNSNISANWFEGRWGIQAVAFCFIASVVATAYDGKLTIIWNDHYKFFKQTLAQQKSCVELDSQYFKSIKNFESSVPPYAVHTLSILVQIVEEKIPISKVMFLRTEGGVTRAISSCQSQNDKLISDYGNVVHLKKNIPFSDNFLQQVSK